MIFNNQNQRIAELEEQNRQWQLWYMNQQMPPTLPPQQKTATKKKTKQNKNKVNPNPLSTEAKMWLFIIMLSVFSILVIKDWLKEVNEPTNRIENKKR